MYHIIHKILLGVIEYLYSRVDTFVGNGRHYQIND